MRIAPVSFAAALLLPLVHASTEEAKGCTPVTVTVEKWKESKPTTVYLTSTVKEVVEKWKTDYVTVTATTTVVKPTTVVNTVKVTETTTVVKPTTVVNTVEVTITETDVQIRPTTIVDTVTDTEVETDFETVTITVEGPTETVVDTEVSVVTTTVVDTDVSTIVETDVSTVTTTVVEEGPTITVSDCPTPEPLTGLVLCTTRDVNPTYTPTKPLPTDYLWGCPPDKICTPPQEDCNFERSPPSETYYCAPEECKPVPDLPNYVNLTWPTPTDDDCAWRGPALGYFNLDPEPFGLSYDIFDVFGQPVCKDPTPVWGDSNWKPPKGKPGKTRRARRTNNPLARLIYRQFESAPAGCYGVFDDAMVSRTPVPQLSSTTPLDQPATLDASDSRVLIGESAGADPERVCEPDSAFQLALLACEDCAADADWSGEVRSYDKLQLIAINC